MLCCIIYALQLFMVSKSNFRKIRILRNQSMLRWNDTLLMFGKKIKDWDASEDAILKRTQNCSDYFSVIPALFENIDIKEYEGAIMREISTSIAFNIMVHSYPGIIELFLALYFRPDNHHVFHLDKTATDKTRKTFSNIINCYSTKVSSGNIILLPKEVSVAIQWGTSSILKANLIGYRSLLKMNQESPMKWSHVI